MYWEAIMRTFQLHVYKLRTKEALDFYTNEIYPRHLRSFPLFGIEARGFWTAKEDTEPPFFVLACRNALIRDRRLRDDPHFEVTAFPCGWFRPKESKAQGRKFNF